jgi:GNAT superfamily N-acetyltransferase
VITYRWEPCRKLFAEPNLRDLLAAHYQELAVPGDGPLVPLDPDFNRYIQLEDLKLFRVWTARDGKTLVGYIAWYIHPHLHHRGRLCAIDELYWLAPEYRRGLIGYRLFSTAIAALKELGVFRIIVHAKVHFAQERGGLGRFFTKLGFQHSDDVYVMPL